MTRHADPYLAGVGIGCVLLAAYALAGQGLGASGAFASVAAALTAAAVGTTEAVASPVLGTVPARRRRQPAARLARAGNCWVWPPADSPRRGAPDGWPG